MSSYDFCLGCMSKIGDQKVCPKCGYIEGAPQTLPALKPGTVLADRYVVGERQSENGEGMVYIGMDLKKDKKVTIREFFPTGLCTRNAGNDAVIIRENVESVYGDYLADFIEINRAVSKLSELPVIIHIRDLFECNNTVYAVYEYVEGKPLSELIRRAKRLTWEEARPLFMPLVSAMVSAHALGLVHFGISPETIIMTKDGKLRLGSFSIPDSRISETELEAELFDGYSAIEQYSVDASKGKFTDVYALSAVLFFCLTGKNPPDAISRAYESRLNIPHQVADSIPTHVITAVAGGLQVSSDERIADMEQLREALITSSDRSYESARQRDMQKRSAAPARRDPEQRRDGAPRSPERQSARRDAEQPTAWYKNLSQFQYWLLTTCLAIIVLGTISIIVFLAVRPKLSNGQQGPTVTYGESISRTDTMLDEELYEVPKLVKQKWSEVLTNNDYVMFDIMEVNNEYSDDYAVGEVMWQSAEPGTKVRYGTPIAVKVSLGSEMCSIPNIIGMTISQADSALTGAGLKLGTQTERYDDTVEAGKIITVDGASIGAKMRRDSAVNVVVSLGREG